MTPDEIEALFTRQDGYLFARWGRPIVPVVFGVDDKTLAVEKGAIEAVVALAGHRMAETDPELGSNLMIFFFRDWDELLALDGLERMVPELGETVARLKDQDANQYRFFRFEKSGEIKAGFVFLRMDDALSAMAAEDLALAQAAVYLALAPKSDALYKALAAAEKDVQHTIGEPVPLHLRNAATKLMKDIGYGHGYEHAHNRPGAVVDMECLPSSLAGRQYYHPSDRGVEQRIQDRLADLRRRRAKPNEE